jgi:hypothetical protein
MRELAAGVCKQRAARAEGAAARRAEEQRTARWAEGGVQWRGERGEGCVWRRKVRAESRWRRAEG